WPPRDPRAAAGRSDRRLARAAPPPAARGDRLGDAHPVGRGARGAGAGGGGEAAATVRRGDGAAGRRGCAPSLRRSVAPPGGGRSMADDAGAGRPRGARAERGVREGGARVVTPGFLPALALAHVPPLELAGILLVWLVVIVGAGYLLLRVVRLARALNAERVEVTATARTLEALVEASPLAIFLVDEETRVREVWNP